MGGGVASANGSLGGGGGGQTVGGGAPGAGGAGTDFDAAHGSGGGGGSASWQSGATGGAGGLYGGGGAGGGGDGLAGAATGGNGAQGLIVITYTRTLTFTSGVNLFGNASVLGSLSKGAGTFVIDHPLDPQNMLLYHSFVESPEPKNIYDGNATLGQDGSITIELPAYFLALNKDFRYLASPVGDAMPDLHLDEEVHHKYFDLFGPAVFSISGGKAGGEISWQITGNRHDPFILAHPIVVEVEKGPGQLYDNGQCLVPSLCL